MTKPRRSPAITEGRSHVLPTAAPAVRQSDSSGDFVLIDRLVRREPDAWREFVQKYQRLILARVLRTLGQHHQQGDHGLAEDVCAEVFAQLLADNCARLRRFEGRSKLSTWLDVIARRVCLRKLQQSRPVVGFSGDAADDFAASDDDLAAILQAEEATYVRSAMKQLSDADRCVIELFYFQELSYRQIATELDLSINTVGPKLQRAQTRLGKILNAGQTIRTAASDS